MAPGPVQPGLHQNFPQEIRMDVISSFAARYERTREEELSLEEYLAECKRNPLAYATAAERMLKAIGEPTQIDTRNDPRLSRIFQNKVIKVYPAFAEFYGMEDSIEQVVSYFRHAAQGLEEKKQILYLLGPVGGGKSSIAERLKQLMQDVPFYAIKGSPVNESPLGLFDAAEDGLRHLDRGQRALVEAFEKGGRAERAEVAHFPRSALACASALSRHIGQARL